MTSSCIDVQRGFFVRRMDSREIGERDGMENRGEKKKETCMCGRYCDEGIENLLANFDLSLGLKS